MHDLLPVGNSCFFVCRRRLEKRIYIPLPNEEERKELLNINLNVSRSLEIFHV